MNCAGSIEAQEGLPQAFNEQAELGTGAHSLGERTLRAGHSAVDRSYIGEEIYFPYDRKTSAVTVTADMVEHVNTYIDFLLAWLKERPKSKLTLEKNIRLKFISPGMFGHSDAVGDAGRLVLVCDFKYGFIPVHLVADWECFDFGDYDGAGINEQLLTYGAGILHELEWIPEQIALAIVQPRCFDVPAVQYIVLPSDWVFEWAEKTLRPAAEAASKPGAPRKAGPWCQWCMAQPFCQEFKDNMQKVAGMEFNAELSVIKIRETISDADLIAALKWEGSFETFFKQLNGIAYGRAMRGVKLPGRKVVKGKSSRDWPFPTVQTALDAFEKELPGVSLEEIHRAVLEPVALKSPAQLEDVGPEYKKAVAKLARKTEGGLTLALESDRRKAVEVLNEFEQFANDLGIGI